MTNSINTRVTQYNDRGLAGSNLHWMIFAGILILSHSVLARGSDICETKDNQVTAILGYFGITNSSRSDSCQREIETRLQDSIDHEYLNSAFSDVDFRAAHEQIQSRVSKSFSNSAPRSVIEELSIHQSTSRGIIRINSVLPGYSEVNQ